MTKKEMALTVIERLKAEYPDAGCTLDYNEAWKLLVSVRLAAQCTDARVNVVVEDLYKKKDLRELLHLQPFEFLLDHLQLYLPIQLLNLLLQNNLFQ